MLGSNIIALLPLGFMALAKDIKALFMAMFFHV